MSGAVPPAPTIVLGGSGYVAGELLRLLAGHPGLRLAGIVSESQAGQPVEAAFPHLAGCFPDLKFAGRDELERLLPEAAPGARAAALCAAPHGAAAPLVDALLAAAERRGVGLALVDLSADFRFPAAAAYERVYGHPHAAPHRIAQFRCGLPEHARLGARRAAEPGSAANDDQPLCVSHPGCFTTAALLPAVPLLRLGLIEPRLDVVAVTGSTGAGRTPGPTTHHPARRSNLFAYNPLRHRHAPEMRALAAEAAGRPVEIHFVPQAGPFARGIYATLQARLAPAGEAPREAPGAARREAPLAAGVARGPAPGEEPARGDDERAAAVRAALADFYAGAPFVEVLAEAPRLQDVVGTNRCRLGVAVEGDRLVVFSALDNLVKGAAGGAIQWLNQMLGFAEEAGLALPGLGWL